MSVPVLIDMNLSPNWVDALESRGIQATHWSEVGKHDAADAEIMQWAIDNNQIVFTHDLDFGTMLALTKASRPSVIQVRTDNVMPDALVDSIAGVVRRYERELLAGALIVVDESRERVRVLPLAN